MAESCKSAKMTDQTTGQKSKTKLFFMHVLICITSSRNKQQSHTEFCISDQ